MCGSKPAVGYSLILFLSLKHLAFCWIPSSGDRLQSGHLWIPDFHSRFDGCL